MASGPALREVREALARFASAFDPALVAPADAEALVREAAAIENIAATVKGLAARRAAESGRWRRDGERSPAHALARQTGSTVPRARAALDTAERLTQLPEL